MHESYLASLLNVQLWYWEAHRTMNHMAHQSFGPIFFGSWTDQEYAYWNDHVWVPSLKNSRGLMILHQIFIVSTWLSVCESVLCLLVEPNSQVTSARQCGSASRCLHIPSCWKLLNFGRFTWLSSAAHDFQTIWSLQLLCVPRVAKKPISNLDVQHQNISKPFIMKEFQACRQSIH